MDDLERALTNFIAVAKKRVLGYDGTILTGKLGFTDSGPVPVPGRRGYSWVRILEWNSAPIPVLNLTLSDTPGLPVLVGRSQQSPFEPSVLDVNYGAYGRADLWPSDDANMPPDYRRQSMVQKRQIAPLHGHATSTPLEVGVYPDYFQYNGEQVYFPGDEISISSYVPATGSRYVVVYLVPDADSGTLAVVGGDIVPVLGAGGLPSPADTDTLLPSVPTGSIPVLGVRLVAGQTTITEADFYDVRPIWNAVGGDTAYIETELDDVRQLLWVVEQDIDATITTLTRTLPTLKRHTNTVTVDIGGYGDFTTIKAACDYVATQSPSTTNRWLILVYPNPAGAYSELPFTVPAGCHLVGMQTKPGGSAAQGVQIGYSGTWTGGAFITLDSAAHLANLGISAAVDASASSEAMLISATAGRVNFCQLNLLNSSAQTASLIKGTMQVEGCAINPTGNDIRALYITGSSAVRFCQVFSNGGTNTYGIYQSSGTSTIFFVRLGGSGTSDPDFATDIHRAGGTLILNNVNYKTYSGTAAQIVHADRFWNTRSSIREAPAATEIPLQLKGASSQSADLLNVVDSGSNLLAGITAVGVVFSSLRDAVTNAVSTAFRLAHRSSGTAAAGFGVRQLFQLESSTTDDQDAAAIDVIWSTATHASRTAYMSILLTIGAAALAEVARFDKGGGTAGNTGMMLYDVDNNTVERVSVGAADSGGTGYKVLRIPN